MWAPGRPRSPTPSSNRASWLPEQFLEAVEYTSAHGEPNAIPVSAAFAPIQNVLFVTLSQLIAAQIAQAGPEPAAVPDDLDAQDVPPASFINAPCIVKEAPLPGSTGRRGLLASGFVPDGKELGLIRAA